MAPPNRRCAAARACGWRWWCWRRSASASPPPTRWRRRGKTPRPPSRTWRSCWCRAPARWPVTAWRPPWRSGLGGSQVWLSTCRCGALGLLLALGRQEPLPLQVPACLPTHAALPPRPPTPLSAAVQAAPCGQHPRPAAQLPGRGAPAGPGGAARGTVPLPRRPRRVGRLRRLHLRCVRRCAGPAAVPPR